MGNSYRVSFGNDPMIQKGGGLFSSFVPVRGNIYLTEEADMVLFPSPRTISAQKDAKIPQCISNYFRRWGGCFTAHEGKA